MLEFSADHKKVDLSQVNTKLERHKKNDKVMLAGILLSTVILFSGCGTKADRNSSTDLNRAMVSIGDEYFAVDIVEYTKNNNFITKLKLTDGTSLCVHPSDLQLYNNQSETMKNIENSISAIQIYNSDYYVDSDDYDRALVQMDDSIVVIEISGFTSRNEFNSKLELTDGTLLYVHPMDLILFNSESFVMSQIQEQALNNVNYKKSKRYCR